MLPNSSGSPSSTPFATPTGTPPSSLASPPLAALRTLSLGRTLLAGTPQEHVLLHPLSFDVQRGEVLAVLGPSGSGKSTLLRLLNRLDEPTSGTVELQGVDYRALPPQQLRRRVGMVMQRAYLFPGTAAENIAFGPLQAASREKNQRPTAPSPPGHTAPAASENGQLAQPGQSSIEDLLEQVGLPNYANRAVSTLSGGEAQRVAIARALANHPEILLLDEPTSALDDASKRGIEQLLVSLIHQRGLTCVWVTHDRQQAERMADSVLVLEAGRLISFGPPQGVFDQTAAAPTRDISPQTTTRESANA